MDTGLFLLGWSPVILLTVLAVFFRRSALELSIYGFVYSLLMAIVFYETPLSVTLLTSLDGILTTLPLLLVIITGMLLSALLMETGSLTRIVYWLETGTGDSMGRDMLITFGVGNFMEGSGVIAEPVVAPMLRAAGVSPTGAATLSIIGYAGMMTLELAGIIITVLSLVTGMSIQELGPSAAWLSIPATVLMALSTLLFLPAGNGRMRALGMALVIGLVLGFTGVGIVALDALPISGTLAGLAVIVLIMLLGSGKPRRQEGILTDLAPFLFLILCLFSVNSIPYLRELTFNKLSVNIQIIPVHSVTLRPLFSAYLYILLALFISAGLQRVSAARLKHVFRAGMMKGWRSFVAVCFFGAMGQIISYTGYGPGFVALDNAHNIPWIISQGLVQYTGSFYPIFVPFLGWVGTFLTGYGVASLMLFGKLQVEAADILNTSPAWLAAALAVGTSIGSISSPFKIALAAPMVGAVGKEGQILRLTIPLGIAISFLVGIVVWLFK